MNNKEFLEELSRATGFPVKDCSKLVESVGITFGETLYSGSSINIPGLGRFSTHLIEETIRQDEASGKKILYPPYLEIEFSEAATLAAKIKNSK